MTRNKDWYNQQPRGGNKPYRFAPKWKPETILSIIDDVNKMTDFVDIQVRLVKEYGIGLDSAAGWIEIARRVQGDMNNGLTLEKALERDHERRNIMRRKKKESVQ